MYSTRRKQNVYWKKWYANRSSAQKKKMNDKRRRYKQTTNGVMHGRLRTLRVRHAGQKVATIRQLRLLWEKQCGICPLTNRNLTLQTAELDHICPKSAGGSGRVKNLRWVHKDANQARMKLSDAEFDAVCIDRAKVLGMKF